MVLGIPYPICSYKETNLEKFLKFTFARWFWNQTWTTRAVSPVSEANFSRTFLLGFSPPESKYALNFFRCSVVNIVLGRFGLPEGSSSMTRLPSSLNECVFNISLHEVVYNFIPLVVRFHSLKRQGVAFIEVKLFCLVRCGHCRNLSGPWRRKRWRRRFKTPILSFAVVFCFCQRT